MPYVPYKDYNRVVFSLESPCSEFTRDTFHTSEQSVTCIEGPAFAGHIQSEGLPYVWNAAQRCGGPHSGAAGKQALMYVNTDRSGGTKATAMTTAIVAALNTFTTP